MIDAGTGQRRGEWSREEKGVHAAWNLQWTHLLCSAFKRKGGGKNGSPGGLRGQIQAEGMASSVAIAALFCFHSSEKLPDAPPEGTPGMNRETEKGHKGCKIELSDRNSRSLMCCPLSSCPLRLKIPMMQPCGPHKPTLRPPHPDSVFSAQTWKEASVTHRPQSPHGAERRLQEPPTAPLRPQ